MISVSVRYCRGWILKRTQSRPSFPKRSTWNACSADVLAPVSTFALMRGIPSSGRPTHSRQPTISSLPLFSTYVLAPVVLDGIGFLELIHGCLRFTRVVEAREVEECVSFVGERGSAASYSGSSRRGSHIRFDLAERTAELRQHLLRFHPLAEAAPHVDDAAHGCSYPTGVVGVGGFHYPRCLGMRRQHVQFPKHANHAVHASFDGKFIQSQRLAAFVEQGRHAL